MDASDRAFWQRVNDVLLQALERTPDQWEDFLDQECVNDASLRQEVASLLAVEGGPDLPIDLPVTHLLSRSPTALTAGEQIGCFKIEREIGRGGTGVVYLASRTDGGSPGEVAIKVLKRGMDTDEILRAFRQERRILSDLKHPAIASYYESGVTCDDRPYLVMEFVSGEPIDRYCSSRGLDLQARLRLFLEVCAAVQLAHQNLVIHRDLKPSNILVTADGKPKLLDFGIAKLLHPKEGEAAPTTAAGWRLMTPGYASPEQALGQPMTTASDVYSLGVILYELLTGCRPYLITSSLEMDIRRVICRQRPVKPSLAVSQRKMNPFPGASLRGTTSVNGSAQPAASAGTRRLQRQLTGDLDNIVLMALRKKPEHRYTSVDQFAGDLSRHLDGLPVQAHKAPLGYRAEKFLRRHSQLVLFVATIFLLLVGVVTHLQMRQGRINREHERSEQVSKFLSDLFDLGAEDLGKPRLQLTARDLLDRGTKRIDQQLQGQPRLRSDLMIVLGRGYGSLGLFDAATPLVEGSLDLRRQLYGDVHPEVAESLELLSSLEVSKGHYQEALDLARENLRIYRQLLEPRDPSITRTRHAIAVALMGLGRFRFAEPLLRQTLWDAQQLPGVNEQFIAAIRGDLAMLLLQLGDYDEALELYRLALSDIRRLHGEEHPQASSTRCNLATCLRDLGRYQEAERIYRQILATYGKLLGGEHPAITSVEHELAVLLLLRGELSSAEELVLGVLSKGRRSLGEQHPTYALYRLTQARLLLAQGDAVAAEEVAKMAYWTLGRSLSLDHLQTRSAESVVGECLLHRGRFRDAEPLLIESHGWLAGRLRPGALARREALQRVIDLYEAWGKEDKAADYRALVTEAEISSPRRESPGVFPPPTLRQARLPHP